MKEFNLELAKQGHEVQTRDGDPARIVCYDRKSEEGYYPIVALIEKEGEEETYFYTSDGRYFKNPNNTSELDLFMIETKKTMIQEEKELLLNDLCARLPYDVRCKIVNTEIGDIIPAGHLRGSDIGKFRALNTIEIYPYLRPMSNLTKDEFRYLDEKGLTISEMSSVANIKSKSDMIEIIDFCNSRHIDYRGLITKGLALEAPEGMYQFK